MSETRVCPKCGTRLPEDAPAGLCPKCLVQAGVESEGQVKFLLEPTGPSPASSEFEPPSVEQLGRQFSQLEVLGLLGKGGMGAVYRARQKQLDRLVAVKILPPEVARAPEFAERFSREARALAKLSHSNIVAVHDFGRTDDGLFYFVMEYVDGVNLRQAIQSGRVSPKEALVIVPQVCDALQFAHDEGIIHRDIKPENILIDKRGRVKIADFGLAKLLGHASGDVSLTGTQQVMGTLRYMAPEQMEGMKAVDHRADIYSLGVVFYELLTGELPIGRFALPSKKVEIDVRLDEVVLRALEKEPEQRYQNANEVKTDVQSISTEPSKQSRQPVSSHEVAPARTNEESTRHILRAFRWFLVCVNVLLVPILTIALYPPGGYWSVKLWETDTGTSSWGRLGSWIDVPAPLPIAIASIILSAGVYVFVSALLRSRVTAGGEVASGGPETDRPKRGVR